MLAAKLLASTSGPSPAGYSWGSVYYRDNIKDSVYANGVYVAVGENALILTSTDGATWTKRSAPLLVDVQRETLHAVVWTGTKFLVSAETSKLLESTDGITWDYNYSWPGSASYARAFVWTGSYLCGVTNTSAVISLSSAGTSWSSYSLGISNAKKVAWNGSAFVAVGGSSTVSRGTTANSGATWTFTTNSTGSTSQANAIGVSGNLFLIGFVNGTTRYSTTGSSWTAGTTVATNEIITDIAWGNSLWTATVYYTSSSGNTVGKVYTSSASSGISPGTWSSVYPSKKSLNSVSYSGSTGFLVSGDAAMVITSPTGTLWTQRTSAPTADQKSVATDGNLIICVGNEGSCAISTDGKTWSDKVLGSTSNFTGIAWSSSLGRWVIVGDPSFLAYSDNGNSWTVVGAGTPSWAPNDITVIPGTSTYLVTTNNGLYRSTNGISWTLDAWSSGISLRGVAASSSTSIVVGSPGNNGIYYSTNGTTFTVTSNIGSQPQKVWWNGTRYLVSFGYPGANNSVAVSDSASGSGLWAFALSAASSGAYVPISSNGTNTVALGYNLTGITGPKASVTNVANAESGWATATMDASQYPYGVVYSSTLQRYIAVGENGQIYLSAPRAGKTL